MPKKVVPPQVEELLETKGLAEALGSDPVRQILAQMPVAIAIAELDPDGRIVYANEAFEKLLGGDNDQAPEGRLSRLPGEATSPEEDRPLGQVAAEGDDYIGAYALANEAGRVTVDAWSNVIADEAGAPVLRLLTLVETSSRDGAVLDALQERVREKDMQLLELQHRVKNNLQMITALIRMEAKGVTDLSTGEGFSRLAGRVEALGLLYRALAEGGTEGSIDLGVYLSEIATAVMRAHASEGVRLDLKVDAWPASIDVAMPAGLVVNELLTNALKHAFVGRDVGTITLRSTTDNKGCRVVVADDGVGLPDGGSWPKPGKLSALIVRSLEQNANAAIEVHSSPGDGTRVTILFDCEDAAPSAAQAQPTDALAGPA